MLRSRALASTQPEEFARLFEAVHEGVYIGRVSSDGSLTLSANPYLKLMFGFAPDTPVDEVRPFDPERFVDPQARASFVERHSPRAASRVRACTGSGRRGSPVCRVGAAAYISACYLWGRR